MIRVVVDDIAFVNADAVIRPATTMLEPTTAALRRLEQVGGPAFWQQLKLQQELAVGAAVVTGGGGLTSPYVIHAIIMSAAEPVTAATVRRALTSALQRVSDWEMTSVAVPPVGTGAGGLSLEDAADILAEILGAFSGGSYPRDLQVVVERETEAQVMEAALRRKGLLS